MPDAPAALAGAAPTGPQGAAPGVTKPPVPKNGNGKAPPPAGAKTDAAPVPAPPFRFKTTLKSFGEEIPVDMGEDDLRRELQLARQARIETQRAREAQQKADKLFNADPEAFLKERGIDADEWAATRLAAKARMGLLTPEQREAAEARAEVERLRAEKTKWEESQKTQAEEAEVSEHRQRNIAALKEAFGAADVGLPFNYETTYMAAETARLALDAGIDLTADPKLWAKETLKRVEAFAERYVGGLARLESNDAFLAKVEKWGGGEFMKRLNAAQLERYNNARGIPGVGTRPQKREPAPEPVPGNKNGYLSESEYKARVNARVKEMESARGK